MNHRWNAAAFLECGAAALFLICLFRCLVVESAHLLPVCAVFLPLLAAGGVALVLLRPREDDQPEDGPGAEEDRPDPSGPPGRGRRRGVMGRRSMALTAALLLLCVSCARSPEHTWDSARVQAVLSADGTAAQAAPRSAEASVYTFPVLTGTTLLDGEPITWTSRAQLEYRLGGAPSSGGLVQVRLQIVACTATYRGVTRPVSETPITYSGLTLAVGMGEHTAISRMALDSNAAPDDVSGVVRVLSYGQLSCSSDRPAVCVLRTLEGQPDASFHGGALLPLDTAGCRIAADDTCTLSGVGDCLTLELLVSYHDNGVPVPPQSCRTAGAVWVSARAALDGQLLGTLAMPERQAPYTAWRLA